MKILFFCCFLVSAIAGVALRRICADKYDDYDTFRSYEYLRELYWYALKENKYGIVALFALAMISAVGSIVFFVLWHTAN